MTTMTKRGPGRPPKVAPAATEVQPIPTERPGYHWAVPAELGIPADPLRLQLNLYHQAAEILWYEGETVQTKPVSCADVAQYLANEMTFTTGFLPEGCRWWCNTRQGPLHAIYQKPRIWKLALQKNVKEPAKRFTCPMPGFIFLCTPGQPPWVYAVKRNPTKITDIVYKAPLANIFADGRSCPGSHKYPMEVSQIIDSFFRSFFSETANLQGRSVMFPDNITHLWEFLDGKDKFPTEDLVKHSYVGDLMRQEMK